MQRVLSSAILGAVVMTFLLVAVVPAAAQDYQVSGQVLDKRNKAIPKINVMLRRGLVNIASAETDGNGSYTVKYPAGGAVNLLFNGNTEWYPLVIKNVVGATNNINIQLINRTEKLTLA